MFVRETRSGVRLFLEPIPQSMDRPQGGFRVVQESQKSELKGGETGSKSFVPLKQGKEKSDAKP